MRQRLKDLFSPATAWYLVALAWLAFCGVAALLMAYRCVTHSIFADLIDFRNVPILDSVQRSYESWYMTGMSCGAFAWVAQVPFCRALIRRWEGWGLWLFSGAAALTTGLIAHAVTPASGTTLATVRGTDAWDWFVVALVVATAVCFLRAVNPLSRDVREDEDTARAGAIQGRLAPLVPRMATIYLLCVAAVFVYALYDHLKFWDPSRNGGYHYDKFFESGELTTANLVLYSTSLVFASLAALVACGGYVAYRYLTRPGPASDGRRLSAAVAASWALALMLPWEVKLFTEIRAEGAWILPVGLVSLTFAGLAPVCFVTLRTLRGDLRAANWHFHPSEQGLLAFALFPVYPLLRPMRPRGPRWALACWMLLAGAVLAGMTWFVNRIEDLYDFDDWRQMLRGGQFPALRIFLALAGAYFVFLCGRRLAEVLIAWRVRPRKRNVFEVPEASAGMVAAPESAALEMRADAVPAEAAPLAPLPMAEPIEPVKPAANTGPLPPVLPARSGLWLQGSRWGVQAAALACLFFATWPFWGWEYVSKNVFARTFEFSGRHEFEMNLLHWIFDLDRDGYAQVLHGGDPDNFDASVQGGGLPPAHEAEVPVDEFEIADPEKAAAFPNVALFFLEGIAPDAISAYGKRKLSGGLRATPHIDGVADEGTVFTNMLCPYPSTWDGWFVMVSGRFLRVMEMNTSRPFGSRYSRYNNIHKVMKLAGIQRFCHADTAPYPSLLVPSDDRMDNYEDGFDSIVSDEEEKKGLWRGDKRADRLVDFIDSLEEGERFFLCEHMSDTHFPWERTPKWRAKELGFPDGLEFAEEDAIVEGTRNNKKSCYYQTITRMDAQIGRVIDRLKERGLYDNTIVIIVSDHGCQWWEHEHLYYVAHLYQQSIHVPCIVRVPGLKSAPKSEAWTMQQDLLPTLMDLAGIRPKNPRADHPFPGLSLLPLMRGEGDAALLANFRNRDMLLTTHYDMLGSIRNFREKLIYDRPSGTYLLFDLEKDPQEMHNLADSRPELLQEMLDHLSGMVKKHPAFVGGIYDPETDGPRKP